MSPPSAGSAPLASAEPPVGSSFVKVASPFIAGGQMEGGRDIYMFILHGYLLFSKIDFKLSQLDGIHSIGIA